MIMSFGYCFCLCTLGCSLCLPGIRISDAKKKVKHEIEEINKEFNNKGVSFKIIEKCSTSWIEINLSEMLAIDTDNSQL